MTNISNKKLKEIWGILVILIMFPAAMLAILDLARAFNNKQSITCWIWMVYLGAQLLNRVPIGYKWISDAPHNIERAIFIYGLLIILNELFDFIRIVGIFWIFNAILMTIWLLGSFYYSLSQNKKEYPLLNRVVSASSGIFVSLPIAGVCILGVILSS